MYLFSQYTQVHNPIHVEYAVRRNRGGGGLGGL